MNLNSLNHCMHIVNTTQPHQEFEKFVDCQRFDEKLYSLGSANLLKASRTFLGQYWLTNLFKA